MVWGSKLASFSNVFGVSVSRSFFDRLGVGFGVDLGAVRAPKWGLCWGVWGVWFGVDFGMVSGGVWDPSKIPSSPKSRGELGWGVGPTETEQMDDRHLRKIFERRSLNEGQ